MSDDSIWSAYANTLVTIEMPDGRLVVIPGYDGDDGDAMLDELWHVITARNPASVMLSTDEDQRRHEELLRVLRETWCTVVPAFGQVLDRKWPPEESAAVRDIGTADAAEVGRRFGQLGIFRVGPDRIDVIECSTAEVRPSRRLHFSHQGNYERRDTPWDS